jgi:hypothetical protein
MKLQKGLFRGFPNRQLRFPYQVTNFSAFQRGSATHVTSEIQFSGGIAADQGYAICRFLGIYG